MKIVAGKKLKKVLILFLTLLLLPWEVTAASKNFKIIDPALYQDILKRTGISAEEVETYKDLFTAVENGETDKAAGLQKKLKNEVLLGHVLAEKYLHKSYDSTYEELRGWLKKYPDHPQYQRIKNLAVTKAPGYKPSKPQPEKKKIYASYSWYKDGYKGLKAADREYVKKRLDEFLLAIRRSTHDKAVAVLNDARFKRLMPVKNYDAMSATLASAYFFDGDNRAALKWSRRPIMRSRDATASWFGGLAAWKEKDYKLAADYFGRLARLKNNDPWLIAAGAYWGYRASIKLKRPDEATSNLRIATRYPRTFYGILARYMLTDKVEYDWRLKSHFNKLEDRSYRQEILSSPVLRRAVLLLAAGQNDLAESDLRRNYDKLNIRQKELLLYLAHQYSLANLSYVTAERLKNHDKGREYDAFLYPSPDWRPEGGWKVHPAWVWALIRQESLFSPTVRSHAGACGLMQVMPATAAEVTGDKSYKKNWRPLFDKNVNLTIGQDYVCRLREKDFVGDNLIFLAASYNGGPHNLKRWAETLDYEGDPLLFMEMIPWRETRLYVKRVITNYWMYSSRLGQKPQSLQQFLTGEWPLLDEPE